MNHLDTNGQATKAPTLIFCVAISLILLCVSSARAQTTAFTYQGKLTDAGNPANGNYDLQFKLFDALAGGAQQGATLVRTPVAASAGNFTVTLDFGANVFSSADRFLEIGVRPAGSAGDYTVLAPRQPITSSPYAIQTLNTQQLGGLPATRYVASDANGNVGIGTTNPQSKLTVQAGGYGLTHTSGGVTLGTFVTTAAGGSAWVGTKSNHPLNFFTSDGLPRMTIDTSGNVGIGASSAAKLHVLNTNAGTTAVFAESAMGRGVWGKSTSSRGVYGESDVNVGVWGFSNNSTGVFGESAGAAGVGGFFQNTGGGIALKVQGIGSVGVLQITGGLDLAEHFEVTEGAKPGLLVAIDPRQPGKLAIARGAYNRKVAGVISGANQLAAGMVLTNPAGTKDSMPIALSGRVWVYCDATKHAINPGDSLTTGTTPGHAMKVVNHARAQGAIIGKAMSGLKAGRGLVLALVSLQ